MYCSYIVFQEDMDGPSRKKNVDTVTVLWTFSRLIFSGFWINFIMWEKLVLEPVSDVHERNCSLINSCPGFLLRQEVTGQSKQRSGGPHPHQTLPSKLRCGNEFNTVWTEMMGDRDDVCILSVFRPNLRAAVNVCLERHFDHIWDCNCSVYCCCKIKIKSNNKFLHILQSFLWFISHFYHIILSYSTLIISVQIYATQLHSTGKILSVNNSNVPVNEVKEKESCENV